MRSIAVYIARRLVGSVLTIVGISLVIFVSLQRLVPGSEAGILAGSNGATPQQVHAIEVRLGLTRPILVQYLSWLGNAVHGNLGIAAISGLKVTSVVGQQAPVSLELALLGLIIATVVGVPVGLVAGLLNGRRSDLLFRLPFLVVYSMPFFVSGTLLLLAAAHYFPSLYAASYVSMSQSVVGNMRVMALPALAVGLPVAGLLVQMTRATIVEVITQPYMTTARAVGLRPLRLYGLYALKAACLPILSLEGFMYGILIGGVVVVEDVFSLPGLGRGLLQSIQNLEFIQLEAQVMIIAIAFILGNLIVDVVAPIIDKRLLTT